MPRVPRSQQGTAEDPYVGRPQSLSEVAENIRLAGHGSHVTEWIPKPKDPPRIESIELKLSIDPAIFEFMGVPGREIERDVKEHPVKSRPIEVVGPTSDVWKMDLQAVRRWCVSIAATESFVWLDPPTELGGGWIMGTDHCGQVQQELELLGVTVRVKKAAATDAVLPEVTVATPAQISQSIRDVVFEMAFEATHNLPLDPEIDHDLYGVLEEMLAGEGL